MCVCIFICKTVVGWLSRRLRHPFDTTLTNLADVFEKSLVDIARENAFLED
jgi:hypothetical protein